MKNLISIDRKFDIFQILVWIMLSFFTVGLSVRFFILHDYVSSGGFAFITLILLLASYKLYKSR